MQPSPSVREFLARLPHRITVGENYDGLWWVKVRGEMQDVYSANEVEAYEWVVMQLQLGLIGIEDAAVSE